MNLKRVWASDGTPAENSSSDGYSSCCQWLVSWSADHKKNVKTSQNVWM